jgi:hypothetical protein
MSHVTIAVFPTVIDYLAKTGETRSTLTCKQMAGSKYDTSDLHFFNIAFKRMAFDLGVFSPLPRFVSRGTRP